jgi:hypothetical protein
MPDAEGNDHIEVRLQAPLRFDDESGYWTGEPNEAVLSEARRHLASIPGIRWLYEGNQLILRGEASAVEAAVAILRSVGME